MVKKCSVLGCKSNLGSRRADFQYTSVFSFPRNTDLKRSWLEAISRTDYSPSIHSGVCEHHFDEEDILKYEKFLQTDGTIESMLLKRPRLKKNAIPKFVSDHSENRKEDYNQAYVKEELCDPTYDFVYTEDVEKFEFHYADINESFIKEEIIDDSELHIQIGNDELCYLSEETDKMEVSSTYGIEEVNTHEIGHTCNICGESFIDALDLRAHVEVHVRGFDFRCMICGEAFIDKQACVTHVEEQHSDENVSTCSELKSKSHSTHRKSDVFSNEAEIYSGHTCNICGESFIEALDLRAHVEVHARGFDFRCMICGEDFIDEQACVTHVQEQHSNEDILNCSEHPKTSNKSTKSKSQVSTHQSSDVFSNEAERYSGMKRKKNSYKRSSQLYPCRICGKTFCLKSSQLIHIRKHTGERPFKCRFCQKSFTDYSSRRKHERIHTGEKPYACVVCSKAFNQRVVLRNHIKSNHSSPNSKNRHCKTPYHCSVCTDMFSKSQELVEHLINHCDMNTAKKMSSGKAHRIYKTITGLTPKRTGALNR